MSAWTLSCQLLSNTSLKKAFLEIDALAGACSVCSKSLIVWLLQFIFSPPIQINSFILGRFSHCHPSRRCFISSQLSPVSQKWSSPAKVQSWTSSCEPQQKENAARSIPSFFSVRPRAAAKSGGEGFTA